MSISHKRCLKMIKVKIHWDRKIQTDRFMEHSSPDVVDLEKESRYYNIIDVSCPFDTRVVEKEKGRVDKYQDLKWE